MKKILVVAFLLPFLLLTNIYADENPTLIWGGYGEPSYIEPRVSVNPVTKPIDNSSVCTDFESLTLAQKEYVLNIATTLPADYGLIFMNTDEQLITCYGVWINDDDGQLIIRGHSDIEGAGIYEVYDDGSLSSALTTSQTIKSIFLLTTGVYHYERLGTPFNISTSPCDISTTYSLIVNSNDTSLGSVSGSGNFPQNSEVTVYASAEVDARFVSWSNGSTQNPYTFTLTSNTTLTAIFESTIVAPNLQLPNVTLPAQTINTTQNTYLNDNSSNAVKGGSINLFQIDYYNIYTVVQTAESDQFFDSRNENYYVYQNSSDGIGHYIFAVYDYSKLYVFAPNMSVSSSGFTLTYSQAHNIKYSYASSNGLIQRDVNKFEFEYVDKTLNEYYGYDKLPFNNSSNNENKLEWIGTKAKMLNGQASSMSATLTLNTGSILTNLNFVITDTTNSYENAQMMNNQTVINNNMVQNFENVNNTIMHGNQQTQNIVSSNNTQNDNLTDTMTNFENLEQDYVNDLNDGLNQINFDDINMGQNFYKSGEWVVRVFDSMISDTPISSYLIIIMIIGLFLLMIGRYL